MNKIVTLMSLLINLIITFGSTFAQDIDVIVHRTYIDSTLGSEMVFDFEVINISQFQQTVFEVRTINNLPSNWQSSLCFGVNCFSPSLDSIATTPPLGDPLEPGDTLITSLHVYALTNDGTADVQIQVGTFLNPTDRITLDFIATTIPTSLETENTLVTDYYLAQNYPNPFNPSTKIRYSIPSVIASETKQSANVTLKVYDILGNEVTTLVNEEKPAGVYEVEFNARNLSSGIYFYKLSSGSFTETKKMTVIK